MKKAWIKAVALLIIALIPVWNAASRFGGEDAVTTEKTGLSPVRKIGQSSVRDVQQRIEELEKEKEERILQQQLLAERRENEKKRLEQLREGKITYRQLFSGTLIAGDSLMNGLEVYDILDSANMITKVGASLYHLEDNLERIISNAPKILILHYGVNMIESEAYFIDNFIRQYTDCIERLRSALPDTKIVVSGMLPVSSAAVKAQPVLANCPRYEQRIKQMCEALSVRYLDNTGLLKDGSDYYDLDGIHVKMSFYTDVWLLHVASELEL